MARVRCANAGLVVSFGPPPNPPRYAPVYRADAKLFNYMYCFLGRREELYDLSADPGERVNLRDTADPALLGRLRRELARVRSQ